MQPSFLLTLIFSCIIKLAIGQSVRNDSSSTNQTIEYYSTYNFSHLSIIHHSDTAYQRHINAICSSLGGCLSILSTNLLDSLGQNSVYHRLESMADQFYQEGKPLILMHGLESFDQAQRLNQVPNQYKIFYFGDNSCVSYSKESIGREVFNQKTYSLVGSKEEKPLPAKKKRKGA